MILIDAIFINNGGGKVLLDYLISELEKIDTPIYYLIDERMQTSHPPIKKENVVQYFKPSYRKRAQFYRQEQDSFTKILCFGNLPPNRKTSATVYTYFHQLIYISIPNEFSFKEKLFFLLKRRVLKHILHHTDFWIVQSNQTKLKLSEKFNLDSRKVLPIPFYPPFTAINESIVRKKNTYLYVSNATPHKNHFKLIENFCAFYDKYKIGKLILTVDTNYPNVLHLMDSKQKQEYPIENIGFVDRKTLYKTYLSSEYLIFPSLSESFGLGLIEAIESGCKVIAADLPYTYEVCEPSIVFDPLCDKSMFNAFEKSINGNTIGPTVPKISNNIKELLTLLQE